MGLHLELEQADDATVATLVKPLYAVLDNEGTRPYRVRVTRLSNVLHRKRPQFLLLHDSLVGACYCQSDGPEPPVDGRSPCDYMVAVSAAAAKICAPSEGCWASSWRGFRPRSA